MTFNKRLFAVVLLIFCCAAPARAVFFGGFHRPITDYANGSEVATNGTLISAVNLLNDTGGIDMGPGISTTINGVLFQGTQPGQFFEGGHDFPNASFVYHGGDPYQSASLWSSGGAYATLAQSQLYNTDNGSIDVGDGYGVINLTPGTQYELQVFMLDDRVGIAKTFPLQFQQVQWTGNFDELIRTVPGDNTTAAVGSVIGFVNDVTIGGDTVNKGEIATVRFSIDPGFNGILVNTWNNGAFNGMQLRSIGLLGDYDQNGSIGPGDYQAWKSSLGSTTNLNADGNGDGVVDAADYVIWRNLASGGGAGSGGLSSAAVPEPCTGLMAWAAITLVGGAAARRRFHAGS
jgi:hypothetical protein